MLKEPIDNTIHPIRKNCNIQENKLKFSTKNEIKHYKRTAFF